MPHRRTGSPYWWVCITPPGGGKPIRRSTGTVDRKEAEAIEGEWRARLFRQATWGETPQHTFAEVAAEYLVASLDKRSIADIKRRTARVRAYLGDDQIMENLNGQHIRGFIAERQGEGVAPATINRELDILSAMINHAQVHMEWQLPNPVRGRSLREPEGRVRWITKIEAARLIACARKRRNGKRLADFIELALHTGCRMNELLKLEWRRVDWDNQLIALEGEDTKAARRRTVPLNEVAMAALKRRARQVASDCPGSPWVFAKPDGSRLGAVREGFKSACKEAGIVNFRIHDLRHTCASWLVSEGVPLADVKEVLGHSTIKMTERYAHLAPHRARDAVAKLQSQSCHTASPVRRIDELLAQPEKKKRAAK